ncbi:hypothetical protein F8M41_000055 [Gigaspora margarita]|uniref:Uncharacterized protein n=1 Tax=Gigaspora margarita TaxID=4874 RepID=A0A8H4B5S3_GIGMA|nr:hypothetical protein F8M41_000055 [Gigaspora margarita]
MTEISTMPTTSTKNDNKNLITDSARADIQKFKISKERLEQWRNKIAFELRNNNNYWKKERESMNEADFLEYKQNFRAKMGVPTTSHKKELKNKSLALIEYG